MKSTDLKVVAYIVIQCVIISYGLEPEKKPFDYCKIDCNGTVHTMCEFEAGGGPECDNNLKVYLTRTEKIYIEDNLNRIRDKVANGQTKLPLASNMMKLVWDKELSAIAKRWADQCTQGPHDKCRITKGESETGQTVYLGKYNKYAFDGQEQNTIIKMRRIQKAIRAWYEQEEQIFGAASVESFDPSTEDTVGNFTQIIWGTTTFVGCGYTEFQMVNYVSSRFICNYMRKGNVPFANIYREGEPCSGCPTRTHCSHAFQGLCWNGLLGDYMEDDSDGTLLKSSGVTFILACVISYSF